MMSTPSPRSPEATPGPPAWLSAAAGQLAAELARGWAALGPEADGARPAAVLVLFGDGPQGPDVLLIERSAELRSHASQPAFPGGRTESSDTSRVDTALREAAEEVGLDPAGVEVLAAAPPLYLQASHHLVTVVVGWWHTACAVAPVDPAETSAVARVPLTELADPANRVAVRFTADRSSPAFQVGGMLVWGFTAGVLDVLLRLGGWERPWSPASIIDRPVPRQLSAESQPDQQQPERDPR